MVMLIGHRGAAGLEPENTLRSFERALEEGCDMIEFDVNMTADGIPVVIHDNSVARTTDGTGSVGEMTFDDISRLNAGKGERIPSLEEVLEAFWGRIGMNIELKGEDTGGPVASLLRMFIDERGGGDVIVSSFSPINLKEFTDFGTGIPTAVLVDHIPWGSQEFAVLLGSSAVHPNHEFLLKAFVEECHASGLNVNSWTVDDPDDVKKCLEMGVDGIITDRPDLLRDMLRGR